MRIVLRSRSCHGREPVSALPVNDVAGSIGRTGPAPRSRAEQLDSLFAYDAASKIAVTGTALGALCGLDGVEADGVAESVGVAGDASHCTFGILFGVVVAAEVVVVGVLG